MRLGSTAIRAPHWIWMSGWPNIPWRFFSLPLRLGERLFCLFCPLPRRFITPPVPAPAACHTSRPQTTPSAAPARRGNRETIPPPACPWTGTPADADRSAVRTLLLRSRKRRLPNKLPVTVQYRSGSLYSSHMIFVSSSQ